MTTSNSVETMGQSDQELIGSAKRRKQFLILGGLFLLAILVITAIVLSIVLVKKAVDDDTTELQLNDILNQRFSPRRFNGTWIDDDSYHYFDTNGDFIIYDVKDRKAKVVVKRNSSAFDVFVEASTYEFSADKKYILLASHLVKLYRHSFLAIWQVYDIENDTFINITVNSDNPPLYRLVKFSPMNASMIVVDKSNMYYKASPEANAVEITQDTFNETSIIVNGVPDWVYEEEVFSSNSASWFSPNGRKVAFIQFDDTQVPVIQLPLYGAPGQLKYPEILPVSYPKAGAPNPTVKLFYFSADDFALKQVLAPEGLDAEHLITAVAWANDDVLVSVWMNRVQNKGFVYKCTSSECTKALTLDVDDGWNEFYTEPFFNANGTEMIFIAPHEDYRHIKVLDLNTLQFVNRTSGKFVVTEILKVNAKANVILYTANLESDIKAQHVYAVKNENDAKPVCLTCNLYKDHSYYSAEVSAGGNYIVINSNGPAVPRSDLYEIKVDGASISLANHMELENNNELKSALARERIPNKQFDVLELDNETEAHVMMIVPKDLDTSQKYPLLVEVYGGPDSSSVTNRFSIEWGTYLASSMGVIYAKIDGRGSGLRSNTHLHKLYKNLGTVEVDDQVRAARMLAEKYSYIDSSRMAIWGWSYGGYVSGMSLMRDNDVFRCATSVAPVTDWMLYDSIYTERYMLTPELNSAAYNSSRMMNFVDNITKYDKKYMVIHGTLDDNVHFQQGMLLVRTLERNDIQFKEITYPDEDHSLAHVRPHLYHSLGKFFSECFNLTKQ